MTGSTKAMDLQIHAFEAHLNSIPLSFKNVYMGKNIVEFIISLEDKNNFTNIQQKYGNPGNTTWINEFMAEIHIIFPTYNLNFRINPKVLRLEIRVQNNQNTPNSSI